MEPFRILALHDKPLFDRYLKPFKTRASELSFTNLYMWRRKYDFHHAVFGDFLWVLNVSPAGKWYFSPPIGDYRGNLKESIDAVRIWLSKADRPLIIKKAEKSVTESIMSLYPDEIISSEMRDDFDYLYDFESLRTLKGNIYHKKRNHLNKFLKTYEDWNYETLSNVNVKEVKDCLHRWCHQHDCASDPDLTHERLAILDALENKDHLDFNGGLIRINGIVEAFTLAEQLSSDSTVIHIEKADTWIDGLYAAINQVYLENCPFPTQIVNREQDMGLERLRKAKESYHPVGYVEKYKLSFQQK